MKYDKNLTVSLHRKLFRDHSQLLLNGVGFRQKWEELMRRSLGLAIITLCLLATGYARGATGWERLGSREVDFRADHDTIEVGRSEGRFSQLQIRVKDAPIEISSMVITFGNDEKYNSKSRHRFAQGSGTGTIDLPGNRRTIKRIDFNYRSISRREGKGRVEVYGR